MKTVVHPSARIGERARIGEFVVISENVEIGEDCQIASHVVIHPGTRIGHRVRIDEHAVLGRLPMRSPRSALTKVKDLAPAVLGDGCMVGSFVSVYAGSHIAANVLLADYASVREDATIGELTIIGRGVAVENQVTIGSRCKIEAGAYIAALSSIADDCFVAPHVTLTNDNFLGRWKERFKFHKGVTMKTGARLGANVTVLPGLVIHEDGVAAAGCTVTHDVPPNKIVLGVPARVWRDVPEEQLLENNR